jgi:hypothetical protein
LRKWTRWSTLRWAKPTSGERDVRIRSW